jgi:23S rRNA maturation mini-RNase III
MEDLLPKLDKQLKSLNKKIRNVESLKKYNESDVLYLIFRRGFITLIGILKRKNK